MSSPSSPRPPRSTNPNPTPTTSPPTLKIKTNHCRFCNHLLLATTRDIASLPRRKQPPAQDGAIILPLLQPTPSSHPTRTQNDNNDNDNSEEAQDPTTNAQQTHYTILLSTTVPDRVPSLICRQDGFEKRLFLRCGRCRVVMGYFLDPVHFSSLPTSAQSGAKDGKGKKGSRKVVGGKEGDIEGEEEDEIENEGDEEEEEEEEEEGARVVYILPGAVVETDDLGNEEVRRVLDTEWSGWFDLQ